MMPSFGDNIRALRLSKGYSQDKFAREIGSNQVNVSAWEVGRRVPTFPTIKHIAEVFHVPISSLLPLETSGKEEDEDREMLDLIKTNPKIRQIVEKLRYLSNADLNMLIDVINALTRVRT